MTYIQAVVDNIEAGVYDVPTAANLLQQLAFISQRTALGMIQEERDRRRGLVTLLHKGKVH